MESGTKFGPQTVDRCGLLKRTLGLVLAGGRGERLSPLTRDRTKGAVSFAGMYRLIDFTLSNCLHSGLRRICVLPQYRFESLERHLRQGWNFLRPDLGESLAVVPPQQRIGEDWYQGTADAVHQNVYLLRREAPDYTVILSCDHIYRMDYRPLLERHVAAGAALTIACVEVAPSEASRFGIAEVDPSDRIVSFQEKPARSVAAPGRPGRALASMGVYVFNTTALIDMVGEDSRRQDSRRDFGCDIIPRRVAEAADVYAYDVQREERLLDFYWRDIGTVDAYREASQSLLTPHAPFDLHDPEWPICTYARSQPPARIFHRDGESSCVTDSLVCPGVSVLGGRVHRTILSPGVQVEEGAEVVDAVLMDGVHVGAGARVRDDIVDKEVSIPSRFQLGLDPVADSRHFHVSPGGTLM